MKTTSCAITAVGSTSSYTSSTTTLCFLHIFHYNMGGVLNSGKQEPRRPTSQLQTNPRYDLW